MKPNEKIAIGYITHGLLWAAFVNSINTLLLQRPEKIHSVIDEVGPYINVNRHFLAKKFLETDADWLLMLDTDVILDPVSYDVLIDAADSEKYPLLAGKYFFYFHEDDNQFRVSAQTFDTTPDNNLGWLLSYPQNTIIDGLKQVATGLMIVHRSVLEKIQENNLNSKAPWFWNGLDVDGFNIISEDDYFCEQARNAGINIALHTGVSARHIRKMAVIEDYFLKQSVV